MRISNTLLRGFWVTMSRFYVTILELDDEDCLVYPITVKEANDVSTLQDVVRRVLNGEELQASGGVYKIASIVDSETGKTYSGVIWDTWSVRCDVSYNGTHYGTRTYNYQRETEADAVEHCINRLQTSRGYAAKYVSSERYQRFNNFSYASDLFEDIGA